MFYALHKVWAGWSLRGWFRQIEVNFDAPVPNDQPVLFACNHPNSAVDFMLVNHLTKKDLHVMVRGDVFKNPLVNKLFRYMKMLPVYRMQDGFDSLRNNDSSFAECFKLFDRNGHVLIFSEGLCLREKHLRPLKKGTARLALEYLEQSQSKELLIIPVGINYTYHAAIRKRAYVQFGFPIRPAEYLPLYKKNKAEGLKALTSVVQTELQKRVIDLGRDKEVINGKKFLLRKSRLSYSLQTFPFIKRGSSLFQQEKSISASTTIPQATEKQARKLASLEGSLKASTTAIFPAIALSPFLLVMALWLAIPAMLMKLVLKTAIKDPIFEATVLIIGTGLQAMLSHLFGTIILLAAKEWYILLCWLLMPLCLYPALISLDSWESALKFIYRERSLKNPNLLPGSAQAI